MYKLVIFRSIMIRIIKLEVSITIYLICHKPDVELYYGEDHHSFTTVFQPLIIEETALTSITLAIPNTTC